MPKRVKRVGITTDPQARREFWENKHPNLTNWRIVDRGLTRKQAQEKENRYIDRGYEGHAGGEKKDGRVYSVYAFDHKK